MSVSQDPERPLDQAGPTGEVQSEAPFDLPLGEDSPPRRRLTPRERSLSQRAAQNGKRTQAKSTGDRQKRARPSILNYLAILFAVAFLLLLMAYFQQQRLNDETTDALKRSQSTVQSIQNVMEENEQLKTRVSELENAEEERAEAISQSQALAQRVQEEADRVSAMEWFWQIESAYVQKRYSSARELIEQFEAQPRLRQALPAENTTGTQRFSPADRYQEIYDALY